MKKIFCILILLLSMASYSKKVIIYELSDDSRVIMREYNIKEELNLSESKISNACEWEVEDLIISFNENDVREYYGKEMKPKQKICNKNGKKEKNTDIDKFIVNRSDKVSIYDKKNMEELKKVYYGRLKTLFLREEGRCSESYGDFVLTPNNKKVLSTYDMSSSYTVNSTVLFEGRINDEKLDIKERERWEEVKNNVEKVRKTKERIVEVLE